jgi:hypothetical protein
MSAADSLDRRCRSLYVSAVRVQTRDCKQGRNLGTKDFHVVPRKLRAELRMKHLSWKNVYRFINPPVNASGIHQWPFDLCFPTGRAEISLTDLAGEAFRD